MSLHRFFVSHTPLPSSSVFLNDPGEIRHITRVLRLRAGDEVGLFNGEGLEAEGTIEAVHPEEILIRIGSVRKRKKPLKKIILACAIPKKAKFETIIEKCTELGVSEIVPLLTKRTEVRPAADRAAGKQARYQKIAVNAAKQCRRAWIPRIHPATRFPDMIKSITPDIQAYIPCLLEHKRLLAPCLTRDSGNTVLFLIGPEGDFTPQELDLAVKHSCRPVSLGETVLKVDTAAIAVTALAAALFREATETFDNRS